MLRWLACLVPWMVTTAALAGIAPAKVQLTYQGVFSEGVVRKGDDCYVTPKLAKSWGWNVTIRGDKEADIATEGRLLRVPVIKEDNAFYLNLNEAGRLLGAHSEWDGETYRLLAQVRQIDATESGLTATSTLNVQPKVFRLTTPNRLVVDFVGGKLSEKAVGDIPAWWRVAQYGPDTVRVVIEHPGVLHATTAARDATRTFEYTLPDFCMVAPDKAVVPPIQTKPVANASPGAIGIAHPKVVKDNDSESVLNFATTAPLTVVPAARYMSPNQIEVRFAGGAFTDLDKQSVDGSRWIESVQLTGDNAAAVMVINTKQPLAFFLTRKGSMVELVLLKPGTADRTLIGKVVVIDPGHGGRDPGARSGGVNEKDIALPVGLELAAELRKAGASVIMTRSDDTYPSLDDRCVLANDAKADFFISIHANSNSVVNSRSGGMTFHHKSSSVGRLLAECIQTEIAKVSNIPDMGVWSDGRIYSSGFKVLRDTKMPGVLLELGFVNHRHDRAEMTKSDFKTRISKAVVKGLKVFVGEGK